LLVDDPVGDPAPDLVLDGGLLDRRTHVVRELVRVE
jgi:hypothetical protein